MYFHQKCKMTELLSNLCFIHAQFIHLFMHNTQRISNKSCLCQRAEQGGSAALLLVEDMEWVLWRNILKASGCKIWDFHPLWWNHKWAIGDHFLKWVVLSLSHPHGFIYWFWMSNNTHLTRVHGIRPLWPLCVMCFIAILQYGIGEFPPSSSIPGLVCGIRTEERADDGELAKIRACHGGRLLSVMIHSHSPLERVYMLYTSLSVS